MTSTHLVPTTLRRPLVLLAIAWGAISTCLLSGCASPGESAGRDSLTAHVGNYPQGDPSWVRPKVGVPPFQVDGQIQEPGSLESIAADQLSSLASLTGRFFVVERNQLSQLLREQDLEGIVRPEQMAQMGEVSGVDLLWVGRVTNFRTKLEEKSSGFGIGSIPIDKWRFIGGGDYKKKSKSLTVDCGVDLRLVDPTSGEVLAAHFGEYQRTDAIDAFGVTLLGAGAEASGDFDLDENNRGKILRLALDEAVRKMLPEIDQQLTQRTRIANRVATATEGGAQ